MSTSHAVAGLGPVLLSAALVAGCSVASGAPAASSSAPVPARPSRPAAASPSAAYALANTFTSPVYGYRIAYPARWHVTPAARPWTYGSEATDSRVDVFRSPGNEVVTVTSQRLPAGVTAARWSAAYLPAPGDTPRPECFPRPEAWQPVTMDGLAAGVYGGEFGCNFTNAVLVTAGRAYVLHATPDADHVSTAIFDRGLFDAFLASIRLHPATP